MTFHQFVFNNVIRNSRAYLAYFLSSSFAVMSFFSFAMFIFHPNIINGNIRNSVSTGMSTAEYIIFVFSFLFILYSANTFLKVRNREFGTLILLGISKKQLKFLVFMENMLIGFSSILTGILLGLVLEKFFFLLSSKIIFIEELQFYLPTKAFILTLISFIILFFVISLFTTFFLSANSIINLLKGSKRPKKEPKTSIILSLLALILILGGYFLAYTATPDNLTFLVLPVTFIVTLGTLFFFSQFSVYMIKLLKSKRRFYFKKTNILWISDLAYLVKDNARTLFLVSILSAVAFTSVITLYIFDWNIKNEINNSFPFAYTYLAEKGDKYEKNNIKLIENELNKEQVEYQKIKANIIKDTKKDDENIDKSGFMKLSDYNKIANLLGIKKVTLKENEAVLIPQISGPSTITNELSYQKIIMPLKNNLTIQKIGFTEKIIFPHGTAGQIIVVGNSIYEIIKNQGELKYTFYAYNIPKWRENTEQALKLDKEVIDSGHWRFWAKAAEYRKQKEISGLLLYIGFFIGTMFFIVAGSFLYFRFYTNLHQEKEKYKNISKLGLTFKEMKRSVSIQMAIIFFLPYILATFHTCFALKPLQMVFPLPIIFPIVKILGCFFIIQLIYFLIIRSLYIHQLSHYFI